MSYNATTGQASCDRCGQLCSVGWNTDRMGGFTCGDCLEGRTPLKQEIERLRAEVLEARNEAATVRRAYLHEKARAEDAIQWLKAYEPGPASVLESHAYKGPADRLWACPGCGAGRTPESTPPFCEHCGNW